MFPGTPRRFVLKRCRSEGEATGGFAPGMRQQQRDRLLRAEQHDICILTDAMPWGEARPECWVVRGTAGTEYVVRLGSDGGLSCTCVDAVRHRGHLWCKHCCLVALHAFDVADVEACVVARRIPVGATGPTRTRVDRRNQSCAICFSDFDEEQRLLACGRCRQAFHSECIGRWLQRSATCPTCRDAVHGRNLAEA